MGKFDLVVEISYNMDKSEDSIVKTNIKKEQLKDLLGEYLRAQMGKGEDKRKANEKDEYKITIQLDLRDDTFYTSSDTGNACLTCGIVVHVYEILDKLKVLPF